VPEMMKTSSHIRREALNQAAAALEPATTTPGAPPTKPATASKARVHEKRVMSQSTSQFGDRGGRVLKFSRKNGSPVWTTFATGSSVAPPEEVQGGGLEIKSEHAQHRTVGVTLLTRLEHVRTSWVVRSPLTGSNHRSMFSRFIPGSNRTPFADQSAEQYSSHESITDRRINSSAWSPSIDSHTNLEPATSEMQRPDAFRRATMRGCDRRLRPA